MVNLGGVMILKMMDHHHKDGHPENHQLMEKTNLARYFTTGILFILRSMGTENANLYFYMI